jgi:hypothetical protein
MKRKGLFCLTVLEVPIYDKLTSCFEPVGRQDIMAGAHGRTKPAHHQEAKN